MVLVLVHIGKEDRKLTESQCKALQGELVRILKDRFIGYAALPPVSILHDLTPMAIQIAALINTVDSNWTTQSNPLLHSQNYGLMGGIDGLMEQQQSLLTPTWKARYWALCAAVGFMHAQVPFGESPWQMQLRMRQFVAELVSAYSDVKIILCRSDVFDALSCLLGHTMEENDVPLGMMLHFANYHVTDGRLLLNGQQRLVCGGIHQLPAEEII